MLVQIHHFKITNSENVKPADKISNKTYASYLDSVEADAAQLEALDVHNQHAALLGHDQHARRQIGAVGHIARTRGAFFIGRAGQAVERVHGGGGVGVRVGGREVGRGTCAAVAGVGVEQLD